MPDTDQPAFYGSVLFREWTQLPWRTGQFRGVTGDCKVIAAKDVLGHDVNDRDSNWAITVSGENLDVVVLGCQVSLVVRVTGRRFEAPSLTAVTDIAEVP